MRDDELDNAIDDVARAMTGSQVPSAHTRRMVLEAIEPASRRPPLASLGRASWVGAAAVLLLAAVGLWRIGIRIQVEPPASQRISRTTPEAAAEHGRALRPPGTVAPDQASAGPLAARNSPGATRIVRTGDGAAPRRRPVFPAGRVGGQPSPAIDTGGLVPWDGGPAALGDIPPIVVPAPDTPALDIAELAVAPLTDINPILIPTLEPDRHDPQRRER